MKVREDLYQEEVSLERVWMGTEELTLETSCITSFHSPSTPRQTPSFGPDVTSCSSLTSTSALA
jgi:hypothetical protein